jgi:pyridinium-3,5-biscarboxylic acid mononucleotide synthase
MNDIEIEKILTAHADKKISTDEAAAQLKNLSYENIGYARVDHARATRQGFPEVIFGQGKTRAQIVGIFEKLAARSPNVIITRTDADTFGEIRNITTDAEWHEAANLIRVWRDREELGAGEIAVVTAGTSDIPVAEEAALVAETMGNRVKRIWDAGVADL